MSPESGDLISELPEEEAIASLSPDCIGGVDGKDGP